MNFDALNGAVNEGPLNYYNGGLGSAGTGPGPNYGITFSSNTITGQEAPIGDLNSAGSPSSPNVIFFESGQAATMDVAAGFDTGFSFYYSSVNVPAVVNVYSGLDATGSLLASLALAITPNGASTDGCYGTNFCPYSTAGVTFEGVAHSVDFGGATNQVGFDDITIGSAKAGAPSAVPEPVTWAMMVGGFGLVGGVMRRAHRKSEESFAYKVRAVATA